MHRTPLMTLLSVPREIDIGDLLSRESTDTEPQIRFGTGGFDTNRSHSTARRHGINVATQSKRTWVGRARRNRPERAGSRRYPRFAPAAEARPSQTPGLAFRGLDAASGARTS